MKIKSSFIRSCILIILVGLSACNSSQVTTPTEEEVTPSPVIEVSPTLPTEPADNIFYNGVLITMEASQPAAQAIALRDGRIQAVGSNEDILALRDPDTVLVDLQGRTLMPGFVDGHTHILAFHDRMNKNLYEAQDVALRYGFTTVNEMWADPGYIDKMMQANTDQRLIVRVNAFVNYNDGYRGNDGRRVITATWFPANGPILDPDSHFRIPGIKIFMDGDNYSMVRGCWALSEPFMPGSDALNNGLCGTNRGDLYWDQEELNQVVLQAQEAGYRVAFHAMGDGAIETAINAIEYALGGQSNEIYRHQIEHNSLASPDLLPRYQALDVAAAVRGHIELCDLSFLVPDFGPERKAWYVNRYELPGLGIHAYMETDYGWTVDPDDRFSQRTLDPFMHLYGMVTHRYASAEGISCAPDPSVTVKTITIERALEMLTIEPAWAVSMEDYIGSLKAGKFADLVILSGDPLSIDPNDLKDLSVLMTMVGGKVEYCAAGTAILCPGTRGFPSTGSAELPTSGNLALNQYVTASTSLSTNPPEMAVDGIESTHWGAGDFATQWIEIDLGAAAQVTEIRLLASMYPDGDSSHSLQVMGESGEFTQVHQFNQFTRDMEWLVFQPATPLEDIRYVRIETTASPSWVSWFEIQVIGTR